MQPGPVEPYARAGLGESARSFVGSVSTRCSATSRFILRVGLGVIRHICANNPDLSREFAGHPIRQGTLFTRPHQSKQTKNTG
jgi:hypothetical protein